MFFVLRVFSCSFALPRGLREGLGLSSFSVTSAPSAPPPGPPVPPTGIKKFRFIHQEALTILAVGTGGVTSRYAFYSLLFPCFLSSLFPFDFVTRGGPLLSPSPFSPPVSLLFPDTSLFDFEMFVTIHRLVDLPHLQPEI